MNWWQTLLGIILIAAGITGVVTWWPDFLTVLKGAVGVCVALIGLMFFMIGVTE